MAQAITTFFKGRVRYRIEQFIIFALHLVLLKWIIYTLHNTGRMDLTYVLLHFTGLSVMGACLIVGSAKWARHHWLKEQRR